MSGLGNFEQKKFEFARSGRKLETTLEMLRTLPIAEPQKKIGIIGAGSVGRAVALACMERDLDPILISLDSVGGPDMRGKAMIMEIPHFSFLEPTPMRKMELDFIGKVGEAGIRRPIFDFLTERHDGNAWRFTMNARESAPRVHKGVNLDLIFYDDMRRLKKLPRKAKKAYIAKYGRAEYRKMYMR